MLYKNFSTKTVGIKDVKIENFYKNEEKLHVHCKINREKNKCPCCVKETDKVIASTWPKSLTSIIGQGKSYGSLRP